MSNYKLEVENTEKLKTDINSAFAEINTELEKDDNFVASDLFDVDRCISEIKANRWKWEKINFSLKGVEMSLKYDTREFEGKKYKCYYLEIGKEITSFNFVISCYYSGSYSDPTTIQLGENVTRVYDWDNRWAYEINDSLYDFSYKGFVEYGNDNLTNAKARMHFVREYAQLGKVCWAVWRDKIDTPSRLKLYGGMYTWR